MKVEVQYTPGCPNASEILERTKKLESERDDVTLTITIVDGEGPTPEGFAGSPTVLIDGRNRFGGGRVEAAACALRSPTADQVEAALAR